MKRKNAQKKRITQEIENEMQIITFLVRVKKSVTRNKDV